MNKNVVEESYVVVSPNDKYYTITIQWIPEGDLDIISETPHIVHAAKFGSVREIHEYAEKVKLNDDPYYEGEFIPSKIKKIKVTKTFEEVGEVFIF